MYFPLFDKTPVTLDRSLKQRLLAIGGLTFFKNYHHYMSSLNADHAVGSATATYTAARSASAPATYVDGAGVVQLLTTANVRRRQGGYYDATGFHAQSGEMIEEAGTNLITKSNNVEDAIFTKTNVTADNDDAGSTSPDDTATAPSLTATAIDGTFLLAAGVTAQTYSVWIKRKTGTGAVSITANGGTTYTALTLTSGWIRVAETRASASQTCGLKFATSGDAVYVWLNQFENNPYMTSGIPTTTAALTRPAEVLKYEIAGNRTAATETIFVKFAPESAFANDGAVRFLIDNETKRRILRKNSAITVVAALPNLSDNGTVLANSTTSPAANVSLVIASTFSHSSPYVNVSTNGTSEGTYIAGDWTNPAWGTYFFIGSSSLAGSALNGIIQSVAIYNRALTAAEVLAVYNILQTGGL